MISFFRYNWQVRDEWFEWSNHLTPEELVKKRVGGVGGILMNFLHVVDVEFSWIRAIEGKEDIEPDFSDYDTLEKVKSLSDANKNEIERFFETYSSLSDDEVVAPAWSEEKYTKQEIIHHIIAHEIHHMGQLSVWAKEMGLKPVSANFIDRGLG